MIGSSGLERNAARRLPAVRWPLLPWIRAEGGNVAIIFALSLLPLIGLIGMGADYYRGLSYKSRLDGAADSAALAAISTAKSYINDNSQSETEPNLTNDAVAAGIAQAKKVFVVNAAAASLSVPTTPVVTLSRAGQTFSSKVTYSGKAETSFGKLFGVGNLNIGGTAASSLTMGKYLDFYIVLDVSGSMGIPTTSGGQNQLAAINPDQKSSYPSGCVFACHYPGYKGYALTRNSDGSPYIPLRVDSVGNALQALLQTATQTMTLQNQYRVGIYPFIVHTVQAAALSPDFAIANQVAGNLARYLDNGDCTGKPSDTNNGGRGCGGTHFETIGTDMANYTGTAGDGSSSTSPQPFLFLVTDGADNGQTYSPFNGSTPQVPGSSFQNYCTSLRAKGYTISILYIPYVPIQNPNAGFAGNEDGKVNAIIPRIPGILQTCASSGFFFTANSPQDINSTMQAMFAQALQAARLTQ